MAEVVVNRRFRYWSAFLALSFLVIFARLLPLDAGPGRLPGPDLIVCLAFAWVLRRPSYVPVLLIAFVMLLMDIFFMKPLGLWTAFVVIGSEFLRHREPLWRDLPFLLEWLVVGVVIVVMTLGHALTLALFVVDQPSIGLTLIQMIATILAYPFVVIFSAVFLGLNKAAPGAVDDLGRKV